MPTLTGFPGGRDGGPTPAEIRRYAITGAIVLAVLFLALTTFYQVEADEVAVVQRFGEYVRTEPPGLHFKIPFGIEKATAVKVQRNLKLEFGYRTERAGVRSTFSARDYADESLMLTGDLNIADVEWIVQYRIKDPREFLFNIRNVEETVRAVSEAVTRRVTGDRSATEVLTVGRAEVAQAVQQEMQDLLDRYGSGVQVVTVQLQDVNPPDPVKPSFNEVNRAKQDKERITNEARRAYNKAIPEAEGRANQLVSQAEGYAIDRVNRARGDAQRFLGLYEEYSQAKDVTRRRLYLETMADVLPKIQDKIIVDERLKGIVPLLPLGGAQLPAAAQGKGGGS
jgi:membrane protease subunit HflK